MVIITEKVPVIQPPDVSCFLSSLASDAAFEALNSDLYLHDTTVSTVHACPHEPSTY